MKTTQCERVLRHLKDFGTITSREAMFDYGIYRLASRIADLKNQGYRFEVSFKSEKNRYGETARYAVYRLITTPTNYKLKEDIQ
ncbi:MAG: helix-turn-helix domain-containing protein [Clostridia bacterium]|nr:helix-turn-helix domain-containing protein [Clostridia bacterium]